jgi:hypothetical protein
METPTNTPEVVLNPAPSTTNTTTLPSPKNVPELVDLYSTRVNDVLRRTEEAINNMRGQMQQAEANRIGLAAQQSLIKDLNEHIKTLNLK